MPPAAAAPPTGSGAPAPRTSGSPQRRRAVRAAGAAGTPVGRAPAGRTPAGRSAGGRPAVRPVRPASSAQGAGAAPAKAARSARIAELADRAGARRAHRWRPGRRALAALAGLVALCAAAGWVLLGSPWLRVEQVRITGTERTDRAAVEALVEDVRGAALAGVSTGSLARQVERLPLVASADVTRSWPSTLLVTVHERQAVAAVPSRTGGVDLVDGDGTVLVHAEAPPPGVPVLDVDVDAAGAQALQAAIAVNGSLSPQVRSLVVSIAATSPDAVSLQLADGPRVTWGDASRPERKAEVLLRLLQEPAVAASSAVDVSAPDFATTTP
ncbi:cell division protein FtsQ/DivIB [Kineococcus sp. SYSU DK006]|uniref:cell division protein FtsQ/DivIB n=1 Tax=Kineococcus sp. SYSU DK006 TaxID=3383127 RepID=UPI003D7CF36E